MSTLRNIIVTTTLAAITMSGFAQARVVDGKGHYQCDTTRIERRAERRAARDLASDREALRDNRRSDRGDGYGRVDRRREKQRARIAQGRRSGELSRTELRRLKKQQKKIGRMERRFSSDGYLSGRERRRLERAQDRASRRIARLKHNDIYRSSGHRYAQVYGYRHGYYGFFGNHRY